MYAQRTLIFMVLLNYGYTDKVAIAQGVNQGAQMAIWIPQTIHRAFPRMGWSSMNLGSSIPEAYASPRLSCHGEGFYSHPSDCSKFYRCINDFGSNDYSALTFSCAAGSVFSQELGACVTGSCSPESNNILGINVPWGSHGSLRCVSEGRIADPEDCGQYYDCVRESNGEIVANRQSCYGHAFDASNKECVPVQRAKGCIPKQINGLRSTNVNDPNLQDLCTGHENKFFCMDCKTLVLCIGRLPQIMPCEYGKTCHDDKDSFNGGVCHPNAPTDKCTCINEPFKPDNYDTSKFLTCNNPNADPLVQSCPEGLSFNADSSSCGASTDATCSKSGTSVVQSDCSLYQTCTYTTTGSFFQSVFTCGDKTMYNEEKGICEDPCDWYSGTFTCEAEGRFSNPEDCSKYYECITDPSGSFFQLEHTCRPGYEWLKVNDIYHCAAKGTGDEQCVPKKPNSCKVTQEWCTATTGEQSTTTATTAAPSSTPGDAVETPAFIRQICPDGHFQVGAQCFFIPTEGFKNWYDAQAFCRQHSGFLAEPASIPEFQKALEKESSNYGFWLGGSNKKQDGTWRWSSRGAMVGNSNNWYPEATNQYDTSEKCLFLETGMEKPLAARSCDVEHHYFVCEKH